MAAAINFYAGEGAGVWTDLSSSGMGFFGATFGTSVQVGQYQDSTFISSANGASEGPQATNCKYDTSDGSGTIINGDVAVAPSAVPINSGTMNIRFTFDTVVKTQNCQLRIFDRTTITNGATGVITQVLQVSNGGSGVSSSGTAEAPASHTGWIAPSGSGVTVALLSSAGSGGLSPSGTDTTDTRHDWYACLSATPTSIGSKELFGLYCQLEYL
jgi:hypothetical protein